MRPCQKVSKDVTRVLERKGREQGTEANSEHIMAKNFPKLMKDRFRERIGSVNP